MDRLFSPCTRYRDMVKIGRLMYPFRGRLHPELFWELNLDVSTEELSALKGRLHTRTCTPCWETEIRFFG
jgi:hypothetical protein